MKLEFNWLTKKFKLFSVRFFLIHSVSLIFAIVIILYFVQFQYGKTYMELAFQYSYSVITRLNNELETYLQAFENITNMH